jgi:hypothetical protein
MTSADYYRQKADECVAAAKAATFNEERARHCAIADYYARLAMDEQKSQKIETRELVKPAPVQLGSS